MSLGKVRPQPPASRLSTRTNRAPFRRDHRLRPSVEAPFRRDHRLRPSVEAPLRRDHRPRPTAGPPWRRNQRPRPSVGPPLRRNHRPRPTAGPPWRRNQRPSIVRPIQARSHPGSAGSIKIDCAPTAERPLGHNSRAERRTLPGSCVIGRGWYLTKSLWKGLIRGSHAAGLLSDSNRS